LKRFAFPQNRFIKFSGDSRLGACVSCHDLIFDF
jgi:hypothetical protein